MTRLSLIAVAALPVASAFAPIAPTSVALSKPAFVQSTPLFAEVDESAESVFIAPDESKTDEDVSFAKAESLGRGAAKVKRGKRKGGGVEKKSAAKAPVSLAPEETFFEGPPAITETIVPTISILTVIGIIPAAAAWARQAWVRYKITSRRVRVTSGFGGNDMAEIVYPDIVELRTVKRLFGDGDLVAFLRDGAKFEMRNIPNFEETMEFILDNVDKDVAELYRAKGDVTLPPGGPQ